MWSPIRDPPSYGFSRKCSIFERRFIHDSYASRKGKGTHAAKRSRVGLVTLSNVLTRRIDPCLFESLLRHRLTIRLR